METTQTTTSGVNADTSGSVVEDKTATTKPDEATSGADKVEAQGTDLVAKLKREKENYVKRAQELQRQLDEKEAASAAAKEQDLVQKEQFKTLYEQEKERAAKLSEDLKLRDQRETEALKKASVKQHLIKLGLNPQHEATAFRLMDISTVVVDDETKAVIGSEEAARSFHEQFKTLGLFGKPGVGVSQVAPDTSGGVDEIKNCKTQKELDDYMARKYGN